MITIFSFIERFWTPIYDILSAMLSLKPSKEEKRAYKELKLESYNAYRNILNESVLFEDVSLFTKSMQDCFLEKIIIKSRIPNITVKIEDLQEHKDSFIITGEAGVGKSALVKYLFLQEYNENENFPQKLCIFLAPENISYFLSNYDNFIDNLREANFRHLSLYLDGLDEVISLKKITLLATQLYNITNKVDSVRFIVTCRALVANSIETEFKRCFSLNYFIINAWENKQLVDLSKVLINAMIISKREKQNLRNFIIKYISICNQNPLLLKMLLWAKLQDNSYVPSQNRFAFYSSFLEIIINIYYKFYSEQPVLQIRISDYATIVYKTYMSNVQNRLVENMPGIEKLLKKSDQPGFYIFTHETFFEFLFAWYVCEKIMLDYIEALNVMSYEFPNSFSDFISDGLKYQSDEKIKIIVQRLIQLYSVTLDSDTRENFWKISEISVISKLDNETNLVLNNILKDKDDKNFFVLKYEIVFRIGRLGINNDTITSFLQFVYMQDRNVSFNKTCENKNEREKRIIALKRCCAISASFLGADDIEIDYIYHMLPYRHDDYQELYDRINRTHTLIYYGDLVMQSDGIVDILNNLDDGICSCDKACKKRISRLAKLNDYVDKVKDMNPIDKRVYYFRLFDIATIYTFLESRKSKLQLTWLDKDSQNIIRSFKTDFVGISQKKKLLLDDIKNKTIEKINELLIKN